MHTDNLRRALGDVKSYLETHPDHQQHTIETYRALTVTPAPSPADVLSLWTIGIAATALRSIAVNAYPKAADDVFMRIGCKAPGGSTGSTWQPNGVLYEDFDSVASDAHRSIKWRDGACRAMLRSATGLKSCHFRLLNGLFLEIDEAPIGEQVNRICELADALDCRPAFVVFSGNKSLHTYFRFTEPLIVPPWQDQKPPILRRWIAAQRLLAAVVGGDISINNPGRQMRSPAYCGRDRAQPVVWIDPASSIRFDVIEQRLFGLAKAKGIQLEQPAAKRYRSRSRSKGAPSAPSPALRIADPWRVYWQSATDFADSVRIICEFIADLPPPGAGQNWYAVRSAAYAVFRAAEKFKPDRAAYLDAVQTVRSCAIGTGRPADQVDALLAKAQEYGAPKPAAEPADGTIMLTGDKVLHPGGATTWRINSLPDVRVLLLAPPCGSGKSEECAKLAQETIARGLNVLVLTARIMLGNEAGILYGGTVYHSQIEGAREIKRLVLPPVRNGIGRIGVTTIQSLYKAEIFDVGLIIVDEFCEVRSTFLSDTRKATRKIGSRKITAGGTSDALWSLRHLFTRCLSAGGRIIACDAVPHAKDLDILANLADVPRAAVALAKKPADIVQNTLKTVYTATEEQGLAQVASALHRGEPVMIYNFGKLDDEALALAFSQISFGGRKCRVLTVTADEGKDATVGNDDEGDWRSFDLLICNSTIGSGISYKGSHFKHAFFFTGWRGFWESPRYALGYREAVQAMERARGATSLYLVGSQYAAPASCQAEIEQEIDERIEAAAETIREYDGTARIMPPPAWQKVILRDTLLAIADGKIEPITRAKRLLCDEWHYVDGGEIMNHPDQLARELLSAVYSEKKSLGNALTAAASAFLQTIPEAAKRVFDAAQLIDLLPQRIDSAAKAQRIKDEAARRGQRVITRQEIAARAAGRPVTRFAAAYLVGMLLGFEKRIADSAAQFLLTDDGDISLSLDADELSLARLLTLAAREILPTVDEVARDLAVAIPLPTRAPRPCAADDGRILELARKAHVKLAAETLADPAKRRKAFAALLKQRTGLSVQSDRRMIDGERATRHTITREAIRDLILQNVDGIRDLIGGPRLGIDPSQVVVEIDEAADRKALGRLAASTERIKAAAAALEQHDDEIVQAAWRNACETCAPLTDADDFALAVGSMPTADIKAIRAYAAQHADEVAAVPTSDGAAVPISKRGVITWIKSSAGRTPTETRLLLLLKPRQRSAKGYDFSRRLASPFTAP